jgi:hypothetical protein
MISKFCYKPHIIDINLPKGFYAQTALADLDNDRRAEFIVEQQHGTV